MQSTPAARVALSFVAITVGWIAGYGSFCVIQLTTHFHAIQDFAAMTIFPLCFILLGWAVFVIPIAASLSEESRLSSPALCPLVGLLGTHAVFLALVGWWAPFYREWEFWVYLTAMGLAGGATFSLGLRTRLIRSPRAVMILVLSALGAGSLFSFLVWRLSLAA